MSTTATMSNQDRRFMDHARVGPSSVNKRKERDGFDDPKAKAKPARLVIPRPGSPAPSPKPASSNQILAGYLAHEFLTKGTLFGQPWDPARAEAVPVSAESRRPKPSGQKFQAEMGSRAEPQVEKNQRYVEVADLLKHDGAHLPGIVNPTQLARSLQL